MEGEQDNGNCLLGGIYKMDITSNIKEFLNDRSPVKRYASFDYCFNLIRVNSPQLAAKGPFLIGAFDTP